MASLRLGYLLDRTNSANPIRISSGKLTVINFNIVTSNLFKLVRCVRHPYTRRSISSASLKVLLNQCREFLRIISNQQCVLKEISNAFYALFSPFNGFNDCRIIIGRGIHPLGHGILNSIMECSNRDFSSRFVQALKIFNNLLTRHLRKNITRRLRGNSIAYKLDKVDLKIIDSIRDRDLGFFF